MQSTTATHDTVLHVAPWGYLLQYGCTVGDSTQTGFTVQGRMHRRRVPARGRGGQSPWTRLDLGGQGRDRQRRDPVHPQHQLALPSYAPPQHGTAQAELALSKSRITHCPLTRCQWRPRGSDALPKGRLEEWMFPGVQNECHAPSFDQSHHNNIPSVRSIWQSEVSRSRTRASA